MAQHIGYFPILYSNEKAIEAQIQVGVEIYKKYLGKNPKGIWLPECGYIPESDKYLKKYGLDYIITETHRNPLCRPYTCLWDICPNYITKWCYSFW